MPSSVLSRCGYDVAPAKPITAQPTTQLTAATTMAAAAARWRRLTSNQISTGQRNSFAQITAAAIGPQRRQSARYRHVAAKPTSSGRVSDPSIAPLITTIDAYVAPY